VTGAVVASKKPKLHNSLKERYPAYVAAVESLGEAAARAGPLDEKTVQLVQLAGAAA
jgi:4-carboxymuconolactone decarboxylase